jgi:hypothetical protein
MSFLKRLSITFYGKALKNKQKYLKEKLRCGTANIISKTLTLESRQEVNICLVESKQWKETHNHRFH